MSITLSGSDEDGDSLVHGIEPAEERDVEWHCPTLTYRPITNYSGSDI